jgi:hypothetical protein
MKNYYIREKKGNNFIYTNANGKPLKDKKVLDQIKHIYIAPAYRDVKIYLKSDLLATGVDEAGRTQYIYSSNKGKISLIQLIGYLYEGQPWEIYCLEGNLFEDTERFETKEQAEIRIKEVLD